MEMTVSVRQFYTHSAEFTIIHVGRSNVCNFNIHHHLLIRFVTPPIHTDRFLLLSLSHSLSIAWVVDSYTLRDKNLHMLQSATATATTTATAAVAVAILMALTNYAATVGCLA